MVITQKLTLDVARDGVQGNVILVQGERGSRAIAVTLRCGKVPIALGSGQTAALRGIKPDGGELFNACVVYTEKGAYPNTILYHVTEGTVAAAGTYTVRLTIWNVDGDILWSPEFSITVKDNASLDSEVGSQNEFTALIDAAAQAQRAALEVEEKAGAVGDMIAAHEEEVKQQIEAHEAEIEERLSEASQEADEKYVKLVTTEEKAYCYTSVPGNPNYPIHLAQQPGSYTVARRYDDGRLRIGDPVEELDAVNMRTADGRYVQKVVKKGGISVYTTSEQEPTLALSKSATVGSVARRYEGGRLRAGDPVEELDAVNMGFADKTYVGKAGNQTIDGGLTVKGDFIVEGDSYRTEVEMLNVKDAVIVANSDGVPLAGLSGYVLRTANGDYGILYDPAEDCVKIGLGVYVSETKTFTFNEGEAQPLATRGVIADGNIPVWDAVKRTFVDGGLSIERLKDEIEAAIEACVKDMEPKEEAVPSSVPKRGENAELAVGDPVEALGAVNLRTMNRKTANALIGEKSGGAVVLNDLTPTPNSVKVSVESRNLVPLVYTYAARGKSVTICGVTFAVNEDGSITLNGKNDGTNPISFFLFYSKENALILKKGTYIGSTGSDLEIKGLIKKTTECVNFSSPYTIEEDTAFSQLYFGTMKGSKREFNGETVYPMLMRGTVAEDYVEPVEVGTGVTLTRGEEEIPTAVGETLELSDVAKGSTLSVGDGAALYVEYNRDINEAFAELQQAIISLGGNI